MQRTTLDKLLSWAGVLMASVLLAASVALFWAYDFVHQQVYDQLSAQKINFPKAGSEQLAALPESDRAKVAPYAGQQVVTGKQAQVFADNYIAAHIKNIGGGQAYSELSTQSMANPTDQKLAGKVQTVFRGETLRGMLLNAYAFDTMAIVAYYAALGTLAGGLIMVVLVILGFRHAMAAPTKSKSTAGKKRR